MAKKPKLALIDSHALIHRAYHALPPMSTRGGIPTGAVFGFTSMLLKMFQTLKPTHVVAAFDLKGPTFRHKEFKEYKAQREAAPDDLVAQFDLVREVLTAFDIPILDKKGFEADDIIGTLVEQIDGGVKKIIVTGDMDTLQLVDADTSVFTLRKGVTDTILYDEAKVIERYGFGPELVVDYKGLRGDPSDNIPGVAGIGEKTAKDLVGEYGTIEKIYEHLEELPKRPRTRLTGHKEDAIFSRKLATIRLDVPIKFKLEQARLADYDVDEVMEVFEKFELRSLMQRLPTSDKQSQMTLLKEAEPNEEMPERYHLAKTQPEQQALRDLLSKQKMVAFDTETDSLGARKWPIVGMSFAFRSKAGKPGTPAGVEAWYVPVTPTSVKKWKTFFEDEKLGLIGHNIKYEIEVLRQSGINLTGVRFDTKIAAYLLRPDGRLNSLDNLSLQELGHRAIPISSIIGKGRDVILVSEAPLLELARYAAEDADLTWRLYEVMAPRLLSEGLTTVFTDLELPLIDVLVDMELYGIEVDKEKLAELQIKVKKRIKTLKDKIWTLAGEEFNINSTQQLRVILYEKLKLPTTNIVKTQTGFSTAASELNKLHDEHKIIGYLVEYRELAKLLNTYIATLPELVDDKTNRIYGQINQTVAATGRLSSANPNLQNIPARTDLGQEIRAAFVAGRGKRLVKADYSQIELRIAAHMSQDDKMLATFRANEDIHRNTAAWVNGIGPNDVTDKQRRQAKTLNFGVLYGMGPQHFAQAAEVSVEEARSFIGRYREQYAGLTKYIEATIESAHDLGFVKTLLGRKRYVPEINARAPGIRAAAERAAYNHPIQGTAADILKKAMIELGAHLKKKYPEAGLVLTVHDELVCEVPTKEAEKLAADMKKIMEGVFTMDVPLIVEVAIGKNWRDMEEVK